MHTLEITNTCFDTDSEKCIMRSSTAEPSKGQRWALLRDKGLHLQLNCCYKSAVAYLREAKHVTADDLTSSRGELTKMPRSRDFELYLLIDIFLSYHTFE